MKNKNEEIEENEINEEIEENQEIENKPEKKEKNSQKKPINIMAPAASDPKKTKVEKESLDLTPVIETIKEGFANLKTESVPEEKPKEKSDFENDFLSPLGKW